MCFLVPGFVLLLALLIGIFLDHTDARRRRETRCDVPPLDRW
jgi:hypothetical protein